MLMNCSQMSLNMWVKLFIEYYGIFNQSICIAVVIKIPLHINNGNYSALFMLPLYSGNNNVYVNYNIQLNFDSQRYIY